MTKQKILIFAQARKELKEIVKYLSSNLLEPNIAQNILTEIDKSILSLDEMLYKFVGFQVT